MIWKLSTAILLEVAYAIITRTWLRSHAEGVALELYTTIFRTVNAAAYWFLFKDLIMERQPKLGTIAHPLMVTALLLAFLFPVLVGSYGLTSTGLKVVWAMTGIMVAVKEEFLYRGVLQKLLFRRWGLFGAIVLSNALFAIYHFDAIAFVPSNIVEVFVMGSIIGIIYYATGSITSAIVIHAVYDAIWSFTPLSMVPWPRVWGNTLLIIALGLTVIWVRRNIHNEKNRE
jgi:membrane protease YdiL (CAAX protease family)